MVRLKQKKPNAMKDAVLLFINNKTTLKIEQNEARPVNADPT